MERFGLVELLKEEGNAVCPCVPHKEIRHPSFPCWHFNAKMPRYIYCQLSQSALLDPHPNPPPLGEGA